MAKGWKFRCTECSATYEPEALRYVCPACSKAQKPGFPTRGIVEIAWETQTLIDGWRNYLANTHLSGLQRVAGLLPIADNAPKLPLIVGDTPLVAPERLRRELGLAKLWIKDDTRNPSGSYKDRASALVCLKAHEYGEKVIVAASTGNAATALACISASLGQQAVICVPQTAPRAKLVQMLCYGADLVPVKGSYDQAFELSLKISDELGWYNRNTAYNPFTIEGKKTSSIEIVRDLNERAPDVVVVPTGDGVILSGIAKGFRDLVQAGVIERVPRLLAVQAQTSAAIARAIRDNTDLVPVPNSHTIADSICVDAPRAGILALREIRQSGGSAVMVTDEQIVQAIGQLAKGAGVFAEPAASAAVAGVVQAKKQGLISAQDEVVVMITGHGLKDVATASKLVSIADAVDPLAPSIMQELKQRYSA